MAANSVNNQMWKLKKMISVLEWDIPHIKNDELKAQKKEELMKYKKELEEILSQEVI